MATYTESPEHTLSLTDKFRRHVDGESVSQSLSLTDTEKPIDPVSHSLSMTDGVVDSQAVGVSHSLSPTDSNDVQQQLYESPADSLALVHFAICSTTTGGEISEIVGSDALPDISGGVSVGDVLEY